MGYLPTHALRTVSSLVNRFDLLNSLFWTVSSGGCTFNSRRARRAARPRKTSGSRSAPWAPPRRSSRRWATASFSRRPSSTSGTAVVQWTKDEKWFKNIQSIWSQISKRSVRPPWTTTWLQGQRVTQAEPRDLQDSGRHQEDKEYVMQLHLSLCLLYTPCLQLIMKG